jgi:hypothetical protein
MDTELKDSTCEFPKPTGKGICGAPATQVVTFHGLRWSYSAKACSKCAADMEKEARVNASKDG